MNKKSQPKSMAKKNINKNLFQPDEINFRELLKKSIKQ